MTASTIQRPQSDIYFLHIPKTAGTSLAGMIRTAYAPEESIPAFQWYELVRLGRAEVNRYRCFCGHYGTALYSLLDHDVPTITLLRDPFERAVSNLKYSQGLEKNFLKRKLSSSMYLWVTENIDVPPGSGAKQRERSFVNCGLRDLQTRHLGIDIDLNPFCAMESFDPIHYEWLLADAEAHTTMDAALERAKRRLDSMVVVGTVERFAESTELIFDYLGIPMPEKLRQENVSRGHKVGTSYRNTDTCSPQLTKWIDAITQYDRQLYDYANQLLDRQLASRNLRMGTTG